MEKMFNSCRNFNQSLNIGMCLA
ncbi:hypothetical protein [Helicobacter mehlei]